MAELKSSLCGKFAGQNWWQQDPPFELIDLLERIISSWVVIKCKLRRASSILLGYIVPALDLVDSQLGSDVLNRLA